MKDNRGGQTARERGSQSLRGGLTAGGRRRRRRRGLKLCGKSFEYFMCLATSAGHTCELALFLLSVTTWTGVVPAGCVWPPW